MSKKIKQRLPPKNHGDYGLYGISSFLDSICLKIGQDMPTCAYMDHDIEFKRAMGRCVGAVVGVSRAQEEAKYFKN